MSPFILMGHPGTTGGCIIINNVPGLEHLPGPDAFELEYPVLSIPQIEGELLEEYYFKYKHEHDPSSFFHGLLS